MQEWPAGFADACITDPPHGDTSLGWDKQCVGWVDQVGRDLQPNASSWVFGSMRSLATLFQDMKDAGVINATARCREIPQSWGCNYVTFGRPIGRQKQMRRGDCAVD